MLRWMYEHIRSDKIKNKVIRKKVGVASLVDKIKEARFKWFGHVQRKCVDAPIRRCKRLNVGVTWRDKGRPKNYWEM